MVNRYDVSTTKKYVSELIRRNGVPKEKADISSYVLVEADMRGISSHGINNLDLLVLSSIKDGGTFPDAIPIDVTRNPDYPIRHIDAKGDLGHPPAMKAVSLVKELARKYGIAKVYIYNANHFGAAAIYSEIIAEDKDLAGRVTCTTPALVIPYGGNKKRLGTNLVSWSIPYDKGIITIDMASTVHAVSGIVKAIVEDKQLPFPVYDSQRNLTLNPKSFKNYQDFLSNGSMVPLGGLFGEGQGPKADSGYKGSGLSMLIELDNVIGGGFSQYVSPTVHDKGRWIRQSFEAWRIDTLFPQDQAIREISRTVDDIRAYGGKNMLLPGEKETKDRKDAIINGIPYEDIQIGRLEGSATEVGMARLKPVNKEAILKNKDGESKR